MDTPVSDSSSKTAHRGGQKRDQGGQKPNRKSQKGNDNQGGSAKLRGLPNDSPEVRLSKTVSWILRHGAQKEGLLMREDGYMKVEDLLANPKVKSQSLDFAGLQEIVKADKKNRFHLLAGAEANEWWIRANQGHSMADVKLELKPVLSLADIPSGVAVHGTTKKAWEGISKEGLSKMKRNHIHIAQGVPGDNGVISGMRNSSQVFIFIDIQKAIDAGIKFYSSENGVILTEGNEAGFLKPEFFLKVQDAQLKPIAGWEKAEIPPH